MFFIFYQPWIIIYQSTIFNCFYIFCFIIFIIYRFFNVIYSLEKEVENQNLKSILLIFIDRAKKVKKLHPELYDELEPMADLFESYKRGVEYMGPEGINIGDIFVDKKLSCFSKCLVNFILIRKGSEA